MRVRNFRPVMCKPYALVSRLCRALSKWWPAFCGPVHVPRPLFSLEAMEPRLLLSADLTYATLDTAPMFNFTGITTYAASLASTNYTLKAENDSGTLYWRLYGTGTDLVPFAATKVLESKITVAADLDVNVKRSDLGLTDVGGSGLNLSDFIGDKLTIDLDSLNVLDAQFAGTTIDIDFAGGKDIDIGSILGLGPLPVPIANDQLILSGNAGTFAGHALKVHSSSDIVNEAGGVQTTATGGLFEVISDSAITIDAASVINAPNITLTAYAKSTGLVKGLLADATSTVTVNNATLTATGGTVTLLSKSEVDVNEDGDNFFSNGLSATLVTSFSSALVDIRGASVISAKDAQIEAFVDQNIVASAQQSTVKVIEVLTGSDPKVHIGGTAQINLTGALTAQAHSDAVINATAQPGSSNTNANFDAAIVNVNVLDNPLSGAFTAGADLVVDGSAGISATGDATLQAKDVLAITTNANGNVVGTAGAAVAVTTVTGTDTTAALTGASHVNAGTLNVEAINTRNVITTAASTPGGASGNSAPGAPAGKSSGSTLTNNNAKTSDGSITISGAVAVGVLNVHTGASIDSSATQTATTVNVKSQSTDTVTTTATGENTTGTSLGAAIAVAINVADLRTESWLGGTGTLAAGTVNVIATEDAANTFTASATAGAGGKSDVGVAGGFAFNALDTSVRAYLKAGANINVTGDLNLTATNSTHVVTKADPTKDGVSGKSLGIGANVALSLVDSLTEASLETGASASGIGALTMQATGTHKVETEAKAGVKSSDGVAITPVVALTFTNDTTKVTLDTDDVALATSKALDATATQDTDVSTKAKGDAKADGSFALGLAFALSSTNDSVSASTARSINAIKDVGLKARSASKAVTESEADAGGANNSSNKGKKANEQAADQRTRGNMQAASAGQKPSNSQSSPQATTADGPVSIAAAFAIGLSDTDASATVVNGASVTSGGTVTISSLVNDDESTKATGEAVKAGSVGVGVAVAATRANVSNVAEVKGGGAVSGDGINIEAGMRDLSGDKQHSFGSEAKSGAGAEGGVGVAGALGLTISTTEVRAGVAAGGAVTLADGSDVGPDPGALQISATEDAKNTSKAEPTVTADSFGLGASLGLSIATHEVTAQVDNDASVVGAKDVSVLAKSNLDVDSQAKAGVKAGVALSPVVAISLVDTSTQARMGGLTSGLSTIGGNLSITAEHSGNLESHADGSVESTKAAIGLSVAVTDTHEHTRALLERSLIVGGNVTVESKGLYDASAAAKATATGAADKEDDTSNKNVDQKGAAAQKGAEDTKKENNAEPKKEVQPAPNAGEVHFASAKSDATELDSTEKQLLDTYADYLKANPTSKATVSGFTDTVGAFYYNLDLAKKRATTVRQYLIDQGVNAAQIHILWYGETNLATPTGNGVDNQANRRAEVAVTGPDASFDGAPNGDPNDATTVLFDFDKDDPTGDLTNGSQNKTDLDDFATLLLAHPGVIATIGGHTDTSGNKDYNIDLSMRRANHVADYLFSKGVSRHMVCAAHRQVDVVEIGRASCRERVLVQV